MFYIMRSGRLGALMMKRKYSSVNRCIFERVRYPPDEVASAERENFGIKVIYEDSNVILVRKSGNVAMNPTEDKLLHRRAAPCVESWAAGYLQLDKNRTLPMISTVNHPSFSGVVLLLKSINALQFFEYVKNGEIRYRYSAVVLQREIDPIKVSWNLGNTIEVYQNASSGSYSSGLSIISVFVRSSNTDVGISHVADLLSRVGLPCHQEGSVPFISLMELIIGDDNHSVIENVTRFQSSQNSSHPKKFLKFLRREELLYQRRLQLASNISGSASYRQLKATDGNELGGIDSGEREPTGQSTCGIACTFRGLRLSVPQEGLRPRDSSGVLLDAALSIIRGNLSPDERAQSITGLRVLDIGCGSGALLLSLIHEYNHSKIDQTSVKNSPLLVSGCGIDIDDLALTYAERNYREIFKGRGRGETSDYEEDVQWFNADFTKLRKEHIRLCGIASSWGDFDLVVCNPPYLSQKAGSGRVTAEGEVALIGGKSGLEAYESICKGILQCEEGQRAVSIRPLLSPTAWIVFQTPGGDRGKQRVAELVKSMGFELIEGSAFSNRRCLVIRRRRSSSTNSPRDRD